MPIIKRNAGKSKPNLDGAGIKKRKPAKDKLIYTSKEGVLVVKTPSECTYWPTPFRLRLIADYVAPRTLMSLDTYNRKFVDTGGQTATYRVAGKDIMVRQPIEKLENSKHVVVLRTEVVNLKDRKSMYLYHDEPAMRVLMTYVFLFGKRIPGMPKLDIYDYVP